MAQLRSCRVCGDWHDTFDPWPSACRGHWREHTTRRSDLPAPAIIRDEMSPVRGMADGVTYDSKSALRASYRAHGMREMGNDAPSVPTGPAREKITCDEIAQAVAKVKEGYKPEVPIEQDTGDDLAWADAAA